MLHLELIWGIPIYFEFLRWHQCSSLVVTVFLGILFRRIGPHLAARGKSHEFSRVAACTWCIFSSYGIDGHLKLGFFQRSQDSCLVMTDTSGS